MNFEKLKNPKDNVIDVTKPRRFSFLSVVQASSPIDCDIGIAVIELNGGADGSTGGGAAEVEDAVEDGTVLADVEALELAVVGVVVVGEDLGGNGG